MLLNSKNNNFVLKFPPDFISKELNKKYEPYIRRFPIPFERVIDFLNYTIQGISWPSIAMEPIEQFTQSSKQYYKSGSSTWEKYSKDITITLRLTEGFLNYFIMRDIFEEYWLKGPGDEPYKAPFLLTLLDNLGYSFISFNFDKPVFIGISDIELSYATNVPEYKTFDLSFNYTDFTITRPEA